jgi:hypothetical protein
MKEKKFEYKDSIVILMLLGICFLLILRARYGIDWSDESYYLALAKRFWMGDHFFREEWHTTELIGVLLTPLYSLFRLITGGDEGIVLFMRCCYVAFSGGISIFLYITLSKIERTDRMTAGMAAALYLLYVRANICTLSYYSVGLGTFFLYLLLKHVVKNKAADFLAGISFAVSVICMPYMVVYFIGIVIRRHRQIVKDRFFYLGIGCSAVIFLGYAVSSGDFMDIFANLPYILQDPEHQDTILSSLTGFVWFMLTVFYRYLLWPMVLEFAAIGFYRFKRQEDLRLKKILKIVAYLLFLIQTIYLRTFFEGGVLLAFLILAIQIALLNDCRKEELFRKFFVPGILFGIIWMMGSNVGQRVFNMGGVIADVWAFAVVWEDVRESARVERYFKSLTFFILFGCLVLVRFFDIYRDASVDQLTDRIESGTWKGIYTTQLRKTEYTEVQKALEKYTTDETVLVVSSINPWIYLEASAECGGYSVWRNDLSEDRNTNYYAKYPEKIPDVIFVVNPEYGSYTAWRFSSHGSNNGERSYTEIKGWFEELLENETYTAYEEPCGVFYIKE